MIVDYQKIIMKPKIFFENIKNRQSNQSLPTLPYTYHCVYQRAPILSATIIIRSKN